MLRTAVAAASLSALFALGALTNPAHAGYHYYGNHYYSNHYYGDRYFGGGNYVGGGCCGRAYYGAPAQYVYAPPPPYVEATVNYTVVYPYDPCAPRPLADGYGGWVLSVKAGCN